MQLNVQCKLPQPPELFGENYFVHEAFLEKTLHGKFEEKLNFISRTKLHIFINGNALCGCESCDFCSKCTEIHGREFLVRIE